MSPNYDAFDLDVRMTVTVTKYELETLVALAMAGDTCPWLCNVSTMSYSRGRSEARYLADGGTLECFVMSPFEKGTQGADKYKYYLNREQLLKALGEYISDGSKDFVYDGRIDPAAATEDEISCIFQLALFGQVVYD